MKYFEESLDKGLEAGVKRFLFNEGLFSRKKKEEPKQVSTKLVGSGSVYNIYLIAHKDYNNLLSLLHDQAGTEEAISELHKLADNRYEWLLYISDDYAMIRAWDAFDHKYTTRTGEGIYIPVKAARTFLKRALNEDLELDVSPSEITMISPRKGPRETAVYTLQTDGLKQAIIDEKIAARGTKTDRDDIAMYDRIINFLQEHLDSRYIWKMYIWPQHKQGWLNIFDGDARIYGGTDYGLTVSDTLIQQIMDAGIEDVNEDLNIEAEEAGVNYILEKTRDAIDYCFSQDDLFIIDKYLFDFEDKKYLYSILTANGKGELLTVPYSCVEIRNKIQLLYASVDNYDTFITEITKLIPELDKTEFRNEGYWRTYIVNLLKSVTAFEQLSDEDKDFIEQDLDINLREEPLEEKIVKKGSKWQVQSEDGSKNLGTYDTKKEAEKRLQQVHYFKSLDEDNKVIDSDKIISNLKTNKNRIYSQMNSVKEDTLKKWKDKSYKLIHAGVDQVFDDVKKEIVNKSNQNIRNSLSELLKWATNIVKQTKDKDILECTSELKKLIKYYKEGLDLIEVKGKLSSGIFETVVERQFKEILNSIEIIFDCFIKSVQHRAVKAEELSEEQVHYFKHKNEDLELDVSGELGKFIQIGDNTCEYLLSLAEKNAIISLMRELGPYGEGGWHYPFGTADYMEKCIDTRWQIIKYNPEWDTFCLMPDKGQIMNIPSSYMRDIVGDEVVDTMMDCLPKRTDEDLELSLMKPSESLPKKSIILTKEQWDHLVKYLNKGKAPAFNVPLTDLSSLSNKLSFPQDPDKDAYVVILKPKVITFNKYIDLNNGHIYAGSTSWGWDDDPEYRKVEEKIQASVIDILKLSPTTGKFRSTASSWISKEERDALMAMNSIEEDLNLSLIDVKVDRLPSGAFEVISTEGKEYIYNSYKQFDYPDIHKELGQYMSDDYKWILDKTTSVLRNTDVWVLTVVKDGDINFYRGIPEENNADLEKYLGLDNFLSEDLELDTRFDVRDTGRVDKDGENEYYILDSNSQAPGFLEIWIKYLEEDREELPDILEWLQEVQDIANEYPLDIELTKAKDGSEIYVIVWDDNGENFEDYISIQRFKELGLDAFVNPDDIPVWNPDDEDINEDLDLDVMQLPDWRHDNETIPNYGGPIDPEEVIATYAAEQVWALEDEYSYTWARKGWEDQLSEGFNGFFTFTEAYDKFLAYKCVGRPSTLHLCCKYSTDTRYGAYEGIYSVLLRYLRPDDPVNEDLDLQVGDGADNSWIDYVEEDHVISVVLADEVINLFRDKYCWWFDLYRSREDEYYSGNVDDMPFELNELNGFFTFDEAFEKFKAVELYPGDVLYLCFYPLPEDEDDYMDMSVLCKRGEPLDEDLDLGFVEPPLPVSYKNTTRISPAAFKKIADYINSLHDGTDKPWAQQSVIDKARWKFTEDILPYKEDILSGEKIAFIGKYRDAYMLNVAGFTKDGAVRCTPGAFVWISDGGDFTLYDAILKIVNETSKIKEDLEITSEPLNPIEIKDIVSSSDGSVIGERAILTGQRRDLAYSLLKDLGNTRDSNIDDLYNNPNIQFEISKFGDYAGKGGPSYFVHFRDLNTGHYITGFGIFGLRIPEDMYKSLTYTELDEDLGLEPITKPEYTIGYYVEPDDYVHIKIHKGSEPAAYYLFEQNFLEDEEIEGVTGIEGITVYRPDLVYIRLLYGEQMLHNKTHGPYPFKNQKIQKWLKDILSEADFNKLSDWIKEPEIDEDLDLTVMDYDDSWKKYHASGMDYSLPIYEAENLIMNRRDEFSWWLALYSKKDLIWFEGRLSDIPDESLNGLMTFNEAYKKFLGKKVEDGDVLVLCYHQDEEYGDDEEGNYNLLYGSEDYNILIKDGSTKAVEEDLQLEPTTGLNFNREYLVRPNRHFNPEEIIYSYADEPKWFLEATSREGFINSGALDELKDYNGYGTFEEMYDAFLDYDFDWDDDFVCLVYDDYDEGNDEGYSVYALKRYNTVKEDLELNPIDVKTLAGCPLEEVKDEKLISTLKTNYNIYVLPDGFCGYVKEENSPEFGSDEEKGVFDYADGYCLVIWSSFNEPDVGDIVCIQLPSQTEITEAQKDFLDRNTELIKHASGNNVRVINGGDNKSYSTIRKMLTEDIELDPFNVPTIFIESESNPEMTGICSLGTAAKGYVIAHAEELFTETEYGNEIKPEGFKLIIKTLEDNYDELWLYGSSKMNVENSDSVFTFLKDKLFVGKDLRLPIDTKKFEEFLSTDWEVKHVNAEGKPVDEELTLDILEPEKPKFEKEAGPNKIYTISDVNLVRLICDEMKKLASEETKLAVLDIERLTNGGLVSQLNSTPAIYFYVECSDKALSYAISINGIYNEILNISPRLYPHVTDDLYPLALAIDKLCGFNYAKEWKEKYIDNIQEDLELSPLDSKVLDEEHKEVISRFLLDMGEEAIVIDDTVFEGNPNGVRIEDRESGICHYRACRDSAFKCHDGMITIYYPDDLDNNKEEYSYWEDVIATKSKSADEILKTYTESVTETFEQAMLNLGGTWGYSDEEIENEFLR